MNTDKITSAEMGIHLRYWLLIGMGGLLIGIAASFPLAVILAYSNPISRCIDNFILIRFGAKFHLLPCMPTVIWIRPLVWGSFLTAGALFGLTAHDLVRVGSRILVAIVGGGLFLVASFFGAEIVPRLPSPELPILFESSTAFPFAMMSFGVSFIFALAIGLALRTRGILWRALIAGTVTGICYWLVAWILFGHAVMLFSHDVTTPPLALSLPEMGRLGPMMKTTLISNFIAGTIGGSATLYLLIAGARIRNLR